MRPFNVFSGARHNHRYTKLVLPCLLGRPWGMIWFLSIWVIGTAKLEAAPENFAPPQMLEGSKATSVAQPENQTFPPHNGVGNTLVPLNNQLIAAPENLQPNRDTPVPSQPAPVKPPEVTPPSEEPAAPGEASQLKLEDLHVDFRDDEDNFGQHNQFIEPTFRIRLPNGQFVRFKSGYNTFEQRGFETVMNIPLQAVWEGKVGPVTLQAGGGVDIFNRLPTALNLNFKADAPIFVNQGSDGKLDSGLSLSGVLEQGPYKFNAQTLENEITAWRFGPNVYWQIDRHTSFFTLYRRGQYNDGNHEDQTFSRLERKFGQFFVAANLFTWSYEEDRSQKSGYFSPQDFLVYNGEVGWEGDITNFLRCRVFGNFGQQRLDGTFDNAYSYQSRCTAKISPNVEADFGYGASNVRNRAGDDYNNRSFTGQLRVNF